jgi:predicted dienelactone hydrolase
MRRPSLPSVAATILLLAVAAVPASAGQKCRQLQQPTFAELTAPGPYPVGRRTYTFVDASRPTMPNGDYPGAPDRTLVTEVWFPGSAGGALLDGAPYPVVVHSHGFLDNRLGETYLAEHLASHGYVVAAPDYPLSNRGAPGGATVTDVANQPGDWSFVLDSVLALGNDPASPLHGAADGERVAATGLSLGGLTTLLVTFHVDLRDPRIDAAASLAGLGCQFTRRFYRTTAAPLLLVHGDDDLLVPWKADARKGYRSGRNRLLLTLRDASHTGFSEYATAFDQSQHQDRIGCAAISAALDLTDATTEGLLGALGGKRAGISPRADQCPLPCDGSVPLVEPPMSADRQHEVTKAAVLAFLDGQLRGDTADTCFLRRTLRTENDDLTVKAKGKL